MPELGESPHFMLEPITQSFFEPSKPNPDSLNRGIGPTLADNAWRSRRLVSMTSQIASINDTLCSIFSSKTYETKISELEDGRFARRQITRYNAKPIPDITLGELKRARELRQIKEVHYAKIADMLLED